MNKRERQGTLSTESQMKDTHRTKNTNFLLKVTIPIITSREKVRRNKNKMITKGKML